jgi:hypothetical protein
MNLHKSRSTTFLLALAVTAFASCGGSSDSSNQLNGIWSGYTSAICPQERATAFSSFTEFHVSNGRLTEVFCDSEPIGVTGQFTAREDNLFRLSLSTGEPTAFYSEGDHAAILVSYGRPDEYGMGALQRGGTAIDPPNSNPLDRFDLSGTWIGRTITIDENRNPASMPYGTLEIGADNSDFRLQPDSGDVIDGFFLFPSSPTIIALPPPYFREREVIHYMIPTSDGLFAGALRLRLGADGVGTDVMFGFWTKQ